MHVLHVTPYSEHAWAYGGIPRVVGALTHGLVARGHEVTVCATDARTADERLHPGQVPAGPPALHLFPNLSNRLAYDAQLFLPRGMGAFLRTVLPRVDVVHVHGCHHLPGVVAAREARRAGRPYVLSPHGTAPLLERRRLAKWLFDATVGRRVLPGARALLAVSEAEERQLLQLQPRARVLRLPNPVEGPRAEIRRGAFRARLGIGLDDPLVVLLAKLTPRKGTDVLLEALVALGRKDVQLALVGNAIAHERALRRSLSRLPAWLRVHRVGLLEGEARFEALADATVVASPGRDEVFGLVPFEALLSGTPVVVADDSGAGEWVEAVGGGRVFPVGEAEGLSRALGDVLAARERFSASVRSAAAEVRSRFSPDAICATLEDVYRRVLGEATTR